MLQKVKYDLTYACSQNMCPHVHCYHSQKVESCQFELAGCVLFVVHMQIKL